MSASLKPWLLGLAGLVAAALLSRYVVGPGVVLLVLLFVAFGAIGGSITKSKNRGAGLGWALGLFLSIIGLIIAAVLPALPPPPPAGFKSVRCVRCNAEQNVPVDVATVECWQCHLPISATGQALA